MLKHIDDPVTELFGSKIAEHEALEFSAINVAELEAMYVEAAALAQATRAGALKDPPAVSVRSVNRAKNA